MKLYIWILGLSHFSLTASVGLQSNREIESIYTNKSTDYQDLKLLNKIYEPTKITKYLFLFSFLKILIFLYFFNHLNMSIKILSAELINFLSQFALFDGPLFFFQFVFKFILGFFIRVIERISIKEIVTLNLAFSVSNVIYTSIFKNFLSHFMPQNIWVWLINASSPSPLLKGTMNVIKGMTKTLTGEQLLNMIAITQVYYWMGTILQYINPFILFNNYILFINHINMHFSFFSIECINFLILLSCLIGLTYLQNTNNKKEYSEKNKTFIGRWLYFFSVINWTDVISKNFMSLSYHMIIEIATSFWPKLSILIYMILMPVLSSVLFLQSGILFMAQNISKLFYKIACWHIWTEWKIFYYFNYYEDIVNKYDVYTINLEKECYGQMFHVLNTKNIDNNFTKNTISLIRIYTTNNNNYSHLQQEIKNIFSLPFNKFSFQRVFPYILVLLRYNFTKKMEEHLSFNELLALINASIENYKYMMPTYFYEEETNKKKMKEFFEEFIKIYMPNGIHFADIKDIEIYINNSLKSLEEIKNIDDMIVRMSHIYKNELQTIINNKQRQKIIKEYKDYFNNLKILLQYQGKFYWKNYMLFLNSLEVNKNHQIEIYNNKIVLTRINIRKSITTISIVEVLYIFYFYLKKKYIQRKIYGKMLELSSKKE